MIINYDLKISKQVKHGKMKTPYNRKNGRIVYFLDTETKINFESKNPKDYFILGVIGIGQYAKDGKLLRQKYLLFDKVSDIHTFLSKELRRVKDMVLIAHNVSFDFLVSDLQTWIESEDLTPEIWYNKMTTTYIHATKDQLNLRLLDNMNYYPMPLKALGKSLGIEKLKIDFNNCTKKELSIYCQQDVRIMVKGFETYWQMVYQQFNTQPKWTNGSTAIACFCSLPDKKKIKLTTNTDVVKDCYRGYVGGRVELFKIGKFSNEKLFKLDVNSLYPSVMYENSYPISYAGTIERPKEYDVEEIINGLNAVALVDVNTPESAYPCETKTGHIYPTGKFTAWLMGNDLKYCLENNHYDKIHKIHRFNSDYIFQTYVSKLYKLKAQYAKERKYGFRTVVKFLLNTLYGKFAQLGYTREFLRIEKSKRYANGKVVFDNPDFNYEFEILNYKMYKVTKDVLLHNSQPMVGGMITANARNYMWKLFNIAELRNCYYSDTDSIIVNEQGLNYLKDYLDDDKLGYLKVEGESNELTIYARKSYIFNNKRTLKGIPLSAGTDDGEEFKFKSYMNMQTAVFGKSVKGNFQVQKSRKIRELLPNYYTAKNGIVYPPHLE